MTIVRWNPARDIDALQRELNHLFEDVFPATNRLQGVSGFTPVAELEETAEAYYLRVELPGINKEALDIQVTAEAVSISGDRHSPAVAEENSTVRSEFRYGSFQRVFATPGRINHQAVAADYTDGILTLTLPKAEEEKNKVVKVNLG